MMPRTAASAGRIALTSFQADQLITLSETDLQDLIRRHDQGDWGEVGPALAEENDQSRAAGGETISCFRVSLDLWISTDRPGGIAVAISRPATNGSDARIVPDDLRYEDAIVLAKRRQNAS